MRRSFYVSDRLCTKWTNQILEFGGLRPELENRFGRFGAGRAILQFSSPPTSVPDLSTDNLLLSANCKIAGPAPK